MITGQRLIFQKRTALVVGADAILISTKSKAKKVAARMSGSRRQGDGLVLESAAWRIDCSGKSDRRSKTLDILFLYERKRSCRSPVCLGSQTESVGHTVHWGVSTQKSGATNDHASWQSQECRTTLQCCSPDLCIQCLGSGVRARSMYVEDLRLGLGVQRRRPVDTGRAR